MIVPNETVEKINRLDEANYTIVVNLIDYLAMLQNKNNDNEILDIFDRAREDGKKNPMTEDEVDDFVSSVRKEMYAGRS